MNQKTKAKIKGLVSSYIKLFPEEFEIVKTFIREKKEVLRNEYADMNDTGGAIMRRALYEIPDTLDAMLKQHLTEEELLDLSSKEGGRWFAKNFPPFRITKDI